jgi:predicted NUDIX family NTP pyrophosphohydrolase
MPKQSAGLLIYRMRESQLEVFLVHPGGPLWTKKDLGAWTIPKGEFELDEDAVAAAQRELKEETGFVATAPFLPLGTVRQAGGKIVHAFAARGDFDPAQLVSNTFQLEWPPRSGQLKEFAEVDRGAWFSLDVAATKLNPAQVDLLSRLKTAVTS